MKMQHKKNYEISLFVIGCILINCIGKYAAAKMQLPLWLDSFGTVCSAYALGPVCGGIVGAATNVIYGFSHPGSIGKTGSSAKSLSYQNLPL